MSTDWHIPLNSSLEVSSLMETMRDTFQELLNLSTPVQLYVDSVKEGIVSESLPAFLDQDSGALQVFYQSKENWGTGVQLSATIYPADDDEPEEFQAVVTMTGGGGGTRFRLVTLYGCAIATTRVANSIIEEFSTSPQEWMEAFRCRQQHTGFEEAFEEVLANIRNYWDRIQ